MGNFAGSVRRPLRMLTLGGKVRKQLLAESSSGWVSPAQLGFWWSVTASRSHVQEAPLSCGGRACQDPGHPAASAPNSGTLFPRAEAGRDGSGCLRLPNGKAHLGAARVPALSAPLALAGPCLSALPVCAVRPCTGADRWLMCALFLSSSQTEGPVPQNRR